MTESDQAALSAARRSLAAVAGYLAADDPDRAACAVFHALWTIHTVGRPIAAAGRRARLMSYTDGDPARVAGYVTEAIAALDRSDLRATLRHTARALGGLLPWIVGASGTA